MKITLYELLGMIRDGKIPKKIVYHNYKCYYDDGDYKIENNGDWLFANEYINLNNLNNEIEILEEEKKIPEKLDSFSFKKETDDLTFEECEVENYLSDVTDKINEILDYLETKGE